MDYVSPDKPWDTEDETKTLWHSRINVALVKELAAIIAEVSEIDNDGWTLIGYRGQGSNDAIVLNQWGLTSFTAVRRHVNLIVPSSIANSLAEQHSATVAKVSFPDRVVNRIEKLRPANALRMLDENRAEIQEAYRDLQRRPNTSYSPRRSEHRPELIETLSLLSGIKLRQPEYLFDEDFLPLSSDKWFLRDPSPPMVRPSTLQFDTSLRLVWPKPRLDLSKLPESEADFIHEIVSKAGYSYVAAKRVFYFARRMDIGDKVALHSGTGFSRTAVVGTVRSDYIYDPEDLDYPHKRVFEPRSETGPIWHQLKSDRLTSEGPVDVNDVDWTQIQTNRPVSDAANDSENNSVDERLTLGDYRLGPQVIENHFAASGLHYSGTQIADFYTALQTKGFVVLSGISGTGKSKIATGFTELLPNALHTEIAGPDPVTAYQALRFKVSSSETWAAVSSDQSHLFPKSSTSLRQEVNFVYEGASYRGSYKTRTLNFGKPTLYLILGRALTERLRSSVGEDFVYAQFRVAPQDRALPEIHITQESPAIAQSSQAVETFMVPNTLFLSVRPDWRDSTSLLGYYNPLTKTYEWTDFLRFVLAAAENFRTEDPIAWFVILDEMNLAHVEYYFADLLSVLESGRETDPDHKDYGFTNQPLRLTYPDTVVNEAPPTEVRLPPNLYIIGTVNMDETTHAFSPKVLDRAFTMELTEVDFTDYPRETPVRSEATLDDEAKQEFLQVFSQNGAFPQIRKDEIREFVLANEVIRQSIQRLNRNLAEYRFHFGYRVFDEIMQFLANAEANGMYDDLLSALDSATFMKILPKFSGSEARVGLPLHALIEWASDPFAEGENARPLKRTLNRAEYMQSVLQTDGFVTAF